MLSGVFGVYLSLSTLDLSQRLHTYSSTLLIDVTGAAKVRVRGEKGEVCVGWCE